MTTSLQSTEGTLASDRVAEDTEEQRKVVAKVLRRIMPLALLGIFVSYIDRTNLAVAGPSMEHALGLTPAMFGMASSLFFIGYVLFEIPSNLLLQRLGAKFWIARIMVTWGLICMAMSLVTGATSLYILRFLLGIGEAGFYPGILFYLGLFIPVRYLAKAYSIFQIGIPFSLALGSAMTAALLNMHGVLGVADWQWVMIIEGGMAVVIGIVTFFVMASTPAKARWLSERERTTLTAAIRRDRKQGDDEAHGMQAVGSVIKTPAVWYYALFYMMCLIGFWTVTYWLPQIIKLRFSVSATQAGMLSALPWVVCFFALALSSKMTVRGRARAPFIAVILLICAVGLSLSALASNPIVAFAGLCMAACVQVGMPIFYSFPAQHFPGAKGAVALGLVNSIGNIGGFFGPYILGVLRETFHSDTVGLLFLSSTFLISALLALGLPRQLRKSESYVEFAE
ncbi:major facilitator transporter [Caballeronia calidae]|uniref:Major facilitator transporter n=1 Tax=Caballeronia calidae TaxID=1777139 RepID=A0A158EGK0_9BURK|nr:MFS transporter [Caballeronia calidae]SAL06021.1 major facilitator transporter [Caballeronia calidae]